MFTRDSVRSSPIIEVVAPGIALEPPVAIDFAEDIMAELVKRFGRKETVI
jgi:hypothetical protein